MLVKAAAFVCGVGGPLTIPQARVRIMAIHGSFHLTAIEDATVGIVRTYLVIRY